MTFRVLCPYCEGDPYNAELSAVCFNCDGECVYEVTADELAAMATRHGTITYFMNDKVLYMNANANAVIQTLSDAELAQHDFLVLIDHSGSMGEPSIRRSGISRFEELQEDATAIAREAQRFDADGLTMIAFSSGVRVFDGVTADRVAQTFQEITPRGGTNLTGALEAAFAKVESSSKPAIVLVFTDGEPNDAPSTYALINSIGAKLGRPRIGITFIQVGEVKEAAVFLDTLNGKLGVDVVAVAHAKEAEGLTLGQLAWMAQNR